MYITPVIFSQFTNREDFLQTISLYDDDLNQPINLTGITLATAGSPFTSSAWTVIDGAITTTSATTITIPTFPVGGPLTNPVGASLSALPLTVGTSLAIAAGDAINIVDTATMLNVMTGYVTSYTPSSGALIVQIGWTFDFEIRGDPPNFSSNGYIPWYDFGTPDDTGPIIIAKLGQGILIVDIGFITISIPASTFQTLLNTPFNAPSSGSARTFLACMNMTDSINTRQAFIGRLPVLYGGVGTLPSPSSSTYNPAIF